MTDMSLSEIAVKRQRALDELASLDKAEAEIKAEFKTLATVMHDTLCRWNHTDGCGWMYEDDHNDWTGHAHANWLKHAQNFMAEFDGEYTEVELCNIIRVIKKVKAF